ncbi:hypothetical protein CK222_30145 [Mesorhizobium sp. WSM3866]|uniref:hypothetical protein n=1 Tax=Mesorhizobium sp. WSM3866 TaxID=422271 RepID=UPI000BB0A76C|nr:hypothetical protein [Mesorhizobium sp. WSM3866]PBB40030.1 hypothetical protein CK222_30145 [Mesorhizobium sp. WSM3866]
MIFADRVALFGSTMASRLRSLFLIPVALSVERTAEKKERLCCFDERRLMLHPADMWRSSIHAHNQLGRTIIEATNDDRSGNRSRRLRKPGGGRRPRPSDVADLSFAPCKCAQ